MEYLAKKNVSVLLKSAKKKYAADMTNKKEILEIVERLKETQEKEEEGFPAQRRMIIFPKYPALMAEGLTTYISTQTTGRWVCLCYLGQLI